MSQTHNLGKVAPTPRGAYSSTAQYAPLDIITYNGSSYMVLQSVTGVTPPSSAYYQLIASKGETGADGVNPTVTAGTVTMLPAGSAPTVTNSGTTQTAIFDFGIPYPPTDIVADTFNTSTAYSVGDYCIYSGALYRFTADKTAGAWDGTKVVSVALADDVSDLKSAITRNIAALNEQFEQAGKYEIELNFEKATGYYNKDKRYTTYEGVSVAEVAASAGDVLFLTSRNYYDMARAVYLNSSNDVIDVLFTGNNTSDNSNTRFVAPANTAKILIQTVYSYACTLWKASISDRIGNLDTQVSAVGDATTEPSTIDIPLTFESATGYRDKNGGMNTYSGVTIARVAVTSGQKYEVISRNYYNAAYAFFEDSENTFIQSLWVANDIQKIKTVVTIPSGVAYLVIQRVYAFYPTTVGLIDGIEMIPAKSILFGKKLTLIGDSITEKNFRAKVNWALNLHVWCGAVIQNLGVGGTGFKAGVAQSKNYIARLSQIQASPDVIGVALSWNDMGDSSFPIGTATDTGTESLAGYANDFLDALITAYPTTPIISYSQGPWWSYHPGVERSDEWISVYKQICALKGIPFYSELYDGCTLKPWLLASRQQYYTSDDPDAGNTGVVDDVHPNSEGHKVIARILYPKFAQNLVTTGIDYM